ncbi:MAG: hypothetical protein MK110_08920 [Fuerstiella sp.]|nr:hypothetical protein [Fuerstiella sp.]
MTLTSIDLPLVRRELLQRSQRRRTDVISCAYTVVFFIIPLISLLTMLFICFGPIIFSVFLLLNTNVYAKSISMFCFMSPIVIEVLNQLDGLPAVYHNNLFPESDVLVILMNFLVYGALVIGLREFVLNTLNGLLDRVDDL